MFSLTSWERGNAASLFDRIQEEGSLTSTHTFSLLSNDGKSEVVALVDAVKRHLECLLNTRPGSCCSAPELGVIDLNDKCVTVPGPVENNGCPKVVAVDKSKLATDIELALRDVLFNFNKATVRQESYSKLDLAAQIIKSSQGGTYLLIGHTDKKGSDAYNLALSRARAAEVVKELEKRGVDPSQIKSKGMGEAEAKVAETASDEERLQDRKVQVKYVLDSEWNSIPKNDIPTKLIIKK